MNKIKYYYKFIVSDHLVYAKMSYTNGHVIPYN